MRVYFWIALALVSVALAAAFAWTIRGRSYERLGRVVSQDGQPISCATIYNYVQKSSFLDSHAEIHVSRSDVMGHFRRHRDARYVVASAQGHYPNSGLGCDTILLASIPARALPVERALISVDRSKGFNFACNAEVDVSLCDIQFVDLVDGIHLIAYGQGGTVPLGNEPEQPAWTIELLRFANAIEAPACGYVRCLNLETETDPVLWVRTRDGEHYAKVLIRNEDDRPNGYRAIACSFVYQPDATTSLPGKYDPDDILDDFGAAQYIRE
jgi:hypothetical protein